MKVERKTSCQTITIQYLMMSFGQWWRRYQNLFLLPYYIIRYKRNNKETDEEILKKLTPEYKQIVNYLNQEETLSNQNHCQ